MWVKSISHIYSLARRAGEGRGEGLPDYSTAARPLTLSLSSGAAGSAAHRPAACATRGEGTLCPMVRAFLLSRGSRPLFATGRYPANSAGAVGTSDPRLATARLAPAGSRVILAPGRESPQGWRSGLH